VQDKLHLPRGTSSDGPWSLAITPESAGWDHTSLRVLALGPGGTLRFDTADEEMVLLPLAGSCTVTCDGERAALHGRESVFAAVTDFAYLPIGAAVTVSSERGGRFAFPAARAGRRLPFRYGPAADVPVEVRGAGRCSRQINNFCAADVFSSDRLIAVEVLTPGGNWSSYPPHKHDEYRPGEESELEEIYYFEIAAGGGRPGFGYHRVYGTPERPLDVLAEVRDGDAVLVPHGWHGPSVAAPGHDMYYLNAMAGPGDERAWHICDDPAHAWIRQTWVGEAVDPRVPMTSARTAP
jgi:5-deoxy-glucuronate isomerase